ncbi:MAG: transketolase family protein [Bacilli bacterium]|nr:transketolase family protein [Bacilli bacterium]
MNNKIFLRDVVGNYMLNIGTQDEKVLVVNADLMGTCRNKTFVETYPERSFNVGIAEQNLVSFSAGLAAEGYKPYAFTMAPFMSMRACEQVRTDIAYGNKNVKLIAVYAGLSGGISGPTHWAIEDCGIMCSIPNMIVIEPSDKIETEKLLDISLTNNKPMYFRITTESTNSIYKENTKFEIGKANIPIKGKDGAIICSGVTVQYAIEASKILKEKTGKKFRVIDMHTIKPIDEKAIIEASKTKNIIVVQDHNIIGGLGTMVSLVIANNNLNTKFKILGIPDTYETIGHAKYLYNKYGYDTEGIVKEAIKMLNGE